MRKLKLQVQISVDGFIAGANGEMDWMTWTWDDQLKKCVTDLTAPVDTILLGRKMSEGFLAHWKAVKENPSDEGQDFGKKMMETEKIIFSKTITAADVKNAEKTRVENGDLCEEVKQLKSLPGNHIIAYGGANFDSSLIRTGLIDEYNLFVNPTAIGKGMAIFEGNDKTALKLVEAIPFSCGIVLLKYQPR